MNLYKHDEYLPAICLGWGRLDDCTGVKFGTTYCFDADDGGGCLEGICDVTTELLLYGITEPKTNPMR